MDEQTNTTAIVYGVVQTARSKYLELRDGAKATIDMLNQNVTAVDEAGVWLGGASDIFKAKFHECQTDLRFVYESVDLIQQTLSEVSALLEKADEDAAQRVRQIMALSVRA